MGSEEKTEHADGAGGIALATLLASAVVGYVLFERSENVAANVVPFVVSGTAGLRETPNGAHERWGHRPVVITLDPSLDAVDPAAKDAVRAAFGSWIAGASLPPVTFDSSTVARSPAHDGFSVISYGPITIAGHENDVASTIGYEDAESGLVIEVDTIFNSAYSFGIVATSAEDGQQAEASSTSCRGLYDLQNVATHEAGHFFGLGEDMTDPTTTMYLRSAPCQTHKRELTESDRGIITALYAEPLTSASRGCVVAAPGSADWRAAMWVIVLAVTAAARRARSEKRATS